MCFGRIAIARSHFIFFERILFAIDWLIEIITTILAMMVYWISAYHKNALFGLDEVLDTY